MATTAELLTSARTAYHKLMTGALAVSFRDANGESVTYNIANATKLDLYIKKLEATLATESGGSGPDVSPMRVFM